MITLSVTAILLAAKLEQPMQPSFRRLIAYLEKEHATTVERQEVVDLEENILRSFNFSMQYVSPIPFLERFLRIFGLDQKENVSANKIVTLAKFYCQFMQ